MSTYFCVKIQTLKERKLAILETAIALFAAEGYRATTTKKIAELSRVSEGLIFKHFSNKEGLLQAILGHGSEHLKSLFGELLSAKEPCKCIQAFFTLMRQVKANEELSNFWKLLYKIKWETEQYNAMEVQPIVRKLTWAFENLGYANPQGEAEFLMIWMDGLATHFYLHTNSNVDEAIEFLENKYKK